MMRRIALLFLCLTLPACSSLKARPHRLAIEKLWVRKTLGEDYIKARRIHRFAPILADRMVITGNSIDGMQAYDRESGRLIWRLHIRDGVEAGAQLLNGVLYFGAGDGQFYAVQYDTGKVLWTYPLKAEGLARPLVTGGVVYVLGGNNVVHALNANNGRLLWVYNRRDASNVSIRGGSQPALVDNLLLIGFSDGSFVALNSSSGSVVWEDVLNHNSRFRDVDSSPVVDGDAVYVSSYDGSLYALEWKTGKVLWRVDEGGYGPVLLDGDQLYYSTTDGKTMALDKKSGKILWSKTNPNGIATAPTWMKGVLIIGEMSGALRFLDARTGDFLNEFEPGLGVTSQATVDPKTGDVFFMSYDANLFVLRAKWTRYVKEWPWD